MSRRAAAEPAPVFRFDALDHRYFLDGLEIPHITGMLSDCGYIDDRWFTEDGRDRGTLVHDLAAQYDLGAITDPRTVECAEKGYFLAYVDVMRTVKPAWRFIETALASTTHGFGGRIDRGGTVWGAKAVMEIKTGQRQVATGIQLALQAILVAPEWHLPPEAIVRYELDLKQTGKGALDEHVNRLDFAKAYEVIEACCRQGTR